MDSTCEERKNMKVHHIKTSSNNYLSKIKKNYRQGSSRLVSGNVWPDKQQETMFTIKMELPAFIKHNKGMLRPDTKLKTPAPRTSGVSFMDVDLNLLKRHDY